MCEKSAARTKTRAANCDITSRLLRTIERDIKKFRSIFFSMSNFFHKTYCTIVNAGFSKLSEMTNQKAPLTFEIFTECQTTKARTGRMTLVHHHVNTPVFMPVGTQVYKTLFLLAIFA